MMTNSVNDGYEKFLLLFRENYHSKILTKKQKKFSKQFNDELQSGFIPSHVFYLEYAATRNEMRAVKNSQVRIHCKLQLSKDFLE